MKRTILSIFVIFLVGCVQTISEDLTTPEKQTAETPAVETTSAKTAQAVSPDAVVSCVSDGVDIRQRGRVTLEYGNAQKESTNDGCVEEDELAFKPFKIHYYCEGLEIKSKLYNCGDNSTCVRGTCN